jgi:hypothetical protein
VGKSTKALVVKVTNMNKAVKQERSLNKLERSDVWHSSEPMAGESHESNEKSKHKAKKHHSKDKKPKGKAKVEKVMHEFKENKLHSGSKKGPKVESRKQAIAIALSEARKSGAKIPKKKK